MAKSIHSEIYAFTQEHGFEILPNIGAVDENGYKTFEYHAGDKAIVIEVKSKKFGKKPIKSKFAVLSPMGNYYLTEYVIYRELSGEKLMEEFRTRSEEEVLAYLQNLADSGDWRNYGESDFEEEGDDEDATPMPEEKGKHTLKEIAEKFKMNKTGKNEFTRGAINVDFDGEYNIYREDKNEEYQCVFSSDSLLDLAKQLKQITLEKTWDALA